MLVIRLDGMEENQKGETQLKAFCCKLEQKERLLSYHGYYYVWDAVNIIIISIFDTLITLLPEVRMLDANYND